MINPAQPNAHAQHLREHYAHAHAHTTHTHTYAHARQVHHGSLRSGEQLYVQGEARLRANP